MTDVNKVSIDKIRKVYGLTEMEWGLPLLKGLTEVQFFAAGPIGHSMPLVSFIPESRGTTTTFGVGGLATSSEVEDVGWNNILRYCMSTYQAEMGGEPLYAASMLIDSLFMLGVEPVMARRVVILTRTEASGGWRRSDSHTVHWDDSIPQAAAAYRSILFNQQ